MIEKWATRPLNCLLRVVVMVMMVVVSMSIRPLRLRRIRDCDAEDDSQCKQILLHGWLDGKQRRTATSAGLISI
jgi:hypothetical protein